MPNKYDIQITINKKKEIKYNELNINCLLEYTP